MRDDPALAKDIVHPRAYWRRRLKIVVPLLLWVGVTLPTLAWFGLTADRPLGPTLGALLGLICTGIGLIIVSTPLLIQSTRDLWFSLRAQAPIREAVAALNDGDGHRAENLLLSVLARPGLPTLHAVSLHNLGVAALLQGHLDRARARMEAAKASGWLERFALRRHRHSFLQGRAMVCLGLGALDEAEALLAELSALGNPPAALRDPIELAQLILALKRGDFPGAWAQARLRTGASLRPDARRLLMLLRAWAASGAGQPDDTVQAAREAAEPLKAQESWLLSGWPELQDFARQNGLLDES